MIVLWSKNFAGFPGGHAYLSDVFLESFITGPLFTAPTAEAAPAAVVEIPPCVTFRTNPRTFIEIGAVLRALTVDMERMCSRLDAIEATIGDPPNPTQPVPVRVSLLQNQRDVNDQLVELFDLVAILQQPNPMVLLQTDETLIRE